MRRIYQDAQNVIIWLGASTEDIDCLFHWSHLLEHGAFRFGHADGMREYESRWQWLKFNRHKVPLKSIDAGLETLLGREWFSRIWVIQEAALAKAATIVSGRNNISSQTFVVMPELLGITCNENVQSRLEVMPGSLRKASWWSGPESQGLDILLKKFGGSKAKDPRDIIYALLGLSEDAYTSDVLRPDYQISLQEAIQHTMSFLLIQSEQTKRSTYPTHNDLPTWNMDQFLSALNNLPFHVHEWIMRRRVMEHKSHQIIQMQKPSITPADAGDELSQRHTSLARPGSSWIEIARKMSRFSSLFEPTNGEAGHLDADG